jgi:chromosome partitioning protein
MFYAILEKTRDMRGTSRWQTFRRRTTCRRISESIQTRPSRISGHAMGTAGFQDLAEACARGRADLVSRGSTSRAQKRCAGSPPGRSQIPDPRGARPFPPRAAPEPRPAAGADRNRGRGEMVHPRRGAAPARPFRRRRIEGQGLPPLPSRGPARQDRRGREFQGRGRQDLHRGASGDVGRARRLPGAGDRSRQPGLDDLDLRRAVADEWQTAFPLLARHYAEYLRRRTGPAGPGGDPPEPRRDARRRWRLCGRSDPDAPTGRIST